MQLRFHSVELKPKPAMICFNCANFKKGIALLLNPAPPVALIAKPSLVLVMRASFRSNLKVKRRCSKIFKRGKDRTSTF